MKAAKLFFILLCLAALIAPAAAAGGAGTAANPYVIETPAEFQSIQNNLGAHYVLANDIDFSAYSLTPIGSYSSPFYGTLDGNNHALKNIDLSLTGTGEGIFTDAGPGAEFKNLILSNCKLYLDGNWGGLLFGTIRTSGNVIISNCDVAESEVVLTGGSGGILCGRVGSSSNVIISNCDISNSYLSANSGYCGGLISESTESSTVTITSCTVKNSIISGAQFCGGISCVINSGTISDCQVSNCIIITSSYSYAGGFVGSNSDNLEISDCSVSGCTIYATEYYAGGFAGGTVKSISDSEVLNTVIISNGDNVAGIANSGSSSITNSDVINTNIYSVGGSAVYDIGPSGSYDSTSTATGITHVSNRYLYASGLSYTTSGTTASLTLNNRQGAAVIETATGAAAAMTWTFGDGTTETDADSTQTHTYANGIYSAGVVMSSYLAISEQVFYSTPINIGIPTYTANTVTTQDADIVIDAGQLYQAELQYVLPGTNTDLEFFADNLFIIASGNAVYTVDTATQEITPISTTTGNTADIIYLGENAAVITDINGNTAVYQYEENSFDYLASGDSQLIAATGQYAGVILNGKLSIYDLTEPRKIGDITATVTALAANDYAGTFAGYNDKTLSYWWIENGEIKSATQTLTHTITGIKQIPQTNNYILTTEANTVIVGITSTGGYSLVTTSDTELPLTHPQATTIGVVIGIHAPNEIYVVGADGSTAGTYQTGAALNDASITKATGLYAITGGNDQQAYILRKDQSSTWTLAQTIRANGALSHTQISTTGGYAAIVSGVNMYLLKITTATDTNYYLQGVVIGSTGDVYADKAITINGEKVMTDSSGRFTYPITPGTVYEIVADNTRVDYTATNAALQTLAIRLKPNPFAQSVSYDTKYNSTSGQFEMSYTDSRELTDTVTWVIRETGTQEIVSTQTTEAGQTAYWEVPFDKTFTSYQISMIADRQGTNVENVWILTPDGKNPIDIPGLDETGRNIIFGCVLMIFGGLFGVLHSTKGAILTVAVAGIMTYLGLLTIPWPIIMIAGTLAVLAALAKGSSGQ